MIATLIIDDHAMFRSGLRKVLQDEPDIRVVGESGDWADGLAQMALGHVDLVLLDINLPGRSGLDLLALIGKRFPAVRTMMLSMYAEPQYAVRALNGGARGYITKDMEADDLVDAIRKVMRGRRVVAPSISEALLQASDPGTAAASAAHLALSPRESQILMELVAGRSLTSMAEAMGINVKTVSTYRRRLLEKLQLGSNAQLVQYAVHHGLID